MSVYKEFFTDIENLDFATNSEKKEIASKYGVDSKKKAEIEKVIWAKANEVRKANNTATDEDLKVFFRNIKGLGTKKNAAEALEGESIEFTKALINRLVEKIKRHGNSMAGLSYQRELANVEDALWNKQNASQIKAEEDKTNFIYENLLIPTAPFKVQLYKRYIESEEFRFERAKSIFEEYSNFEYDDKVLFRKEYPNKIKLMNTIKVLSNNFDWAYYLDRINKEFEAAFTNNLKSVAQAISKNKKKINVNNLKLKSIETDPKFFEMILTDNIGNLIHCRSIIAAEYSEKVSTHYRFIVTIKK